jgi:SAM-dependent methyltransferase
MSDSVKQYVRLTYGRAAHAAATGDTACCGDDCCTETADATAYASEMLAGMPAEAVRASLGSGNPIAVADLRPGEIVLDLGSGGGLDALMAARLVRPEGKVYGVDATPEMLQLARENQRRAGIDNVEFLEGEIEAVPLPEASVDVVISNCVINLSTDKERVFREAYRVLRPGGRFVVSDVVARSELPASVRDDRHLWSQCMAGAIDEDEYRAGLGRAGFENVRLDVQRVYEVPEVGVLASAVIKGGKRR